jgi:hypothetical protein
VFLLSEVRTLFLKQYPALRNKGVSLQAVETAEIVLWAIAAAKHRRESSRVLTALTELGKRIFGRSFVETSDALVLIRAHQ